jgi:hypothetical protein
MHLFPSDASKMPAKMHYAWRGSDPADLAGRSSILAQRLLELDGVVSINPIGLTLAKKRAQSCIRVSRHDRPAIRFSSIGSLRSVRRSGVYASDGTRVLDSP